MARSDAWCRNLWHRLAPNFLARDEQGGMALWLRREQTSVAQLALCLVCTCSMQALEAERTTVLERRLPVENVTRGLCTHAGDPLHPLVAPRCLLLMSESNLHHLGQLDSFKLS